MFAIDFADLAWLCLQTAAGLSVVLLAISHLRLRHKVACLQVMWTEAVNRYSRALDDDDWREAQRSDRDKWVRETLEGMQAHRRQRQRGKSKSHDWN